MAGVYTDNQPDFSWLQPYETKTFSQVWYPVQQIGPAKNANRRAAVNLEGVDDKATIGVAVTEALEGASVILSREGDPIVEVTVDLAPDAPFVTHVDLLAGTRETRCRVQLTYLIGLAYRRLGELDAARDAFRSVLDLSPGHADARSQLREIS